MNGQQNILDISFPTEDEGSRLNSENYKNVDIYISKNHEVVIQENVLVYWDEIINKIIELNRDWGILQTTLSNVVLHCDSEVKYRFVDRVKEEIARSGKKTFYYRVGNDSVAYETSINHGTVKELRNDETIKTRNKELDSIKIDKITNPLWSDGKEYDDYLKKTKTFRETLYSGGKEKIKDILFNNLYSSITILPGQKYSKNGITKGAEELSKEIRTLIKNGAIVFINFQQDLDFGEYISYLQLITKMHLNSADVSPGKGFIIEISHGLEKKLYDLKIML